MTTTQRHGSETADRPLALLGLARTRRELSRFLMPYKFALDEISTKLTILGEEFVHWHDYNPIEHVKTRLKTPEDIVAKALRKGCPLDLTTIPKVIKDIAGARVVCSFVADAYATFEMLTGQSDITVVQVKDYMAHPKANGYRSLHAVVQVPVFLSTGPQLVDVEMQFRTAAMDFWASLEHKTFYKYDGDVPARILDELRSTAEAAADLDRQMTRLHREVAEHAAQGSTLVGSTTVPRPIAESSSC